MRGITTYHATIESLTLLSASVLHCQLRSDRPLLYQPGQYAMVTVGSTARAFSFATPSQKQTAEFLIDIRPQGPASRWWQSSSAGQSLTFRAPYGHFLLDIHDTRPLLFIAGSTGLAPIRAHILWLLDQNTTRPITLLVGHSQARDAFWEEKLSRLAADHGFTYRGIIGPLTAILPAIRKLQDHLVYICGSSGMVTSTAETLYQHGVPPAQVHYELFT